MPTKSPKTAATELHGDSGKFTSFMRRLMQVPHSEIKAKLDAEREAKRTSKAASLVSGVPAKQA
jgi:hypothetical protein